jgi:septum formation protein
VLVLASASPRRRALLARLVAGFRVEPVDVDETLDRPVGAAAVAAVALRKARAAAARVERGPVLAADTVVVLEGTPLGKPQDLEDARRMLLGLRARVHEVITGVAVVEAATGRVELGVGVSRVLMRDYPRSAVEWYLATGEPFDKAGAYAIQGQGARLVAGWTGAYSNVVGLPLDVVARLLAGFGVALSVPVPQARG